MISPMPPSDLIILLISHSEPVNKFIVGINVGENDERADVNQDLTLMIIVGNTGLRGGRTLALLGLRLRWRKRDGCLFEE